MKKWIQIHDKWMRWVIYILVVGCLFLGWVFRYSFKASSSLKYPEEPRILVLKETQKLIIERGVTGESHLRQLRKGLYTEVLSNQHGAFYLAPELGYFVSAYPEDGYGVGGVYLSNDTSEPVYVWDYLLENEGRSLKSPSRARPLSKSQDQPEREWFLSPDWYRDKPFSLIGFPLVDTDFRLERTLLEEVGP